MSCKYLSVALVFCFLSACATFSDKYCPDDPSERTGACILATSKQEQQESLDAESAKLEEAREENEALSETINRDKEDLKSLEAQTKRMRAYAAEQERKTQTAEKLLAEARAAGSLSAEELGNLEKEIETVKRTISELKSSSPTSSADISKLTKRRDELKETLDKVLGELKK